MSTLDVLKAARDKWADPTWRSTKMTLHTGWLLTEVLLEVGHPRDDLIFIAYEAVMSADTTHEWYTALSQGRRLQIFDAAIARLESEGGA